MVMPPILDVDETAAEVRVVVASYLPVKTMA